MTRSLRGWAVSPCVVFFVSLAGCGGGETTSGSSVGGTTQTTGQGGTGGAAECGAAGAPAPASEDWCDRLPDGPKGEKSAAVNLSAAHALTRFFGVVPSYSSADQALAKALVSDDALSGKDLSAYAAGLQGVVCARSTSDATLGAATVTDMDGVALVTPGTGPVELPAGTKAVMIDLRDMPWAPGLRDAIAAAVAPALATPVTGLTARVREHEGMVDEVFSATNVYKNKLSNQALPDIPATGAADLPLAVLTDADLPAEAAEIAATLRLANRAWLVGEDLRAEVAESRWQGVGESGVAIRYRDLRVKTDRIPDVIPADRRTAEPQCFAADLLGMGPVPAIAAGAANRPQPAKADPFGDAQMPGDALGDARAALIAAHGAARTFYPYFPTVGDTIDARLEETLSALPAAPTRDDERQALRRFGNALVDGHNFVFNGEPAMGGGYFPAYIEDVDGKPVVRRSGDPAVVPGDTITSINGVPAATFYQTELARSGGATPGYRFNIATREYLHITGPLELDITDAAGVSKTVTVQPHPLADFQAVYVATSRAAGFLDDLGAPELYYVNLDASVLGDIALFKAALTAAASATGLVVDMRGYPGVNHYEVAQRLVQKMFSSPVFRTPVLDGPDQSSTQESSYPLAPLANPSFTGRIVLLVGHTTVSAAENFSIMLVDAQRVQVIGRNSAGTNGNITGVQLPGDFAFTFTGMEVRHADAPKSVFHGVGLVPDIDVPLTAQDFAAGADPELTAAVTWLLSQ